MKDMCYQAEQPRKTDHYKLRPEKQNQLTKDPRHSGLY